MCVKLSQELPVEEGKWARADGIHLSNTESLVCIEEKLLHLEERQRDDLVTILRENKSLFTDVP